MHINKHNNKKYIGLTSKSTNDRFQNGKGYIGCTHFERAIKKYGWDSFDHIILYKDLTKKKPQI